jgi:hypothetical protein
MLLGIVSAVALGSKFRRTHDHTLLSHLRLGSLSVASYDSQGYGGGILSRLHTGIQFFLPNNNLTYSTYLA